MDEDIPDFGNRAAGAEYVLRPGGYCIQGIENGELRMENRITEN